METALTKGTNFVAVDAHEALLCLDESQSIERTHEGTALQKAAENGTDMASIVVAADVNSDGRVDPPPGRRSEPLSLGEDLDTHASDMQSTVVPATEVVAQLVQRDGVDVVVVRAPWAGFACQRSQDEWFDRVLDGVLEAQRLGRARLFSVAAPSGIAPVVPKDGWTGRLCLSSLVRQVAAKGLGPTFFGVSAHVNVSERSGVLPTPDPAAAGPMWQLTDDGLGAVEVDPALNLSAADLAKRCGLVFAAERPVAAVGPDGHPARLMSHPAHEDKRLQERLQSTISSLIALEASFEEEVRRSDVDVSEIDASGLHWGKAIAQNSEQLDTLAMWEWVREANILPRFFASMANIQAHAGERSRLHLWAKHYHISLMLAATTFSAALERQERRFCAVTRASMLSAAPSLRGAPTTSFPHLALSPLVQAAPSNTMFLTGIPVVQDALHSLLQQPAKGNALSELQAADWALPLRRDTAENPFDLDPADEPKQPGASRSIHDPGQL